jgi:hypothetical protein
MMANPDSFLLPSTDAALTLAGMEDRATQRVSRTNERRVFIVILLLGVAIISLRSLFSHSLALSECKCECFVDRLQYETVYGIGRAKTINGDNGRRDMSAVGTMFVDARKSIDEWPAQTKMIELGIRFGKPHARAERPFGFDPTHKMHDSQPTPTACASIGHSFSLLYYFAIRIHIIPPHRSPLSE